MRDKKILIVYTNFSTFVKKDYEDLNKHYIVRRYRFKSYKGIFKNLIQFIKQFFFLCFFGWRFQVFLIWFADYHSVLPILFSKLFHKRSLLIIGGYDATGIKEINYGIFYSNKLRKIINKYSIKLAKYILPVDKSLINGENSYAKSNEIIPVGIKNIVNELKGEIIELPTGYDSNNWKRNTKIKRNSDVMCVAGITNKNTWILKGGDLLLNIAKITSEIDFHFYGVNDSMKYYLDSKNIPINFHIHGYVDNKELPDIYSKHKVYAQFSLSEGLPNVLCEAMLCECVPVGSNVNGIPNVIGNKNFILVKKDTIQAKNLLLKAIESDDQLGKHFRTRIVRKFSQEKRHNTLLKIIND